MPKPIQKQSSPPAIKSPYPKVDFFMDQWNKAKPVRSAVLWIAALLICGTGLVTWKVCDLWYSSEIQAQDERIAKLKDALGSAGVSAGPVKERALILARQISDFGRNWPTNPGPGTACHSFLLRFEDRIEAVCKELDVHGQQSAELDAMTSRGPDFIFLPLSFNASNAFRLSSEISRLANGLKDYTKTRPTWQHAGGCDRASTWAGQPGPRPEISSGIENPS